MTLLESIARMEGWQDPRSRCRRNNNPGNIEAGRFAYAHGAVRSDGRFAIFETPEAGFAAMQALLNSTAYRGLTIAQAIMKWAPDNENNTSEYIHNVCLWSGLRSSDPLATHISAVPPSEVAV